MPRAYWAPYVQENRRDHAAADPAPSSNSDWNPVGGVFIHHRGPPLLVDERYLTEEDCRRDIADVYDKSIDDSYDDIKYNFLVCKHGNVYQGRGYERGEANYAGYVDGLGRNAGFYSICGLMRSNNYPTEPLLEAIRFLIDHLRQEATGAGAPTLTGDKILPHSFEYETECPGNLTMYAIPGSTIDPAVPWSGFADIHVYATQKWVNATYKDAPGYRACPENGRTGWSTVLSLTQGLQHELGISPTVQNFGPGTFDAVKAHGILPELETNTNLVRIYNGALWCKGYWTSTQQQVWSADSQTAIESLFTDAGLPDVRDPAMWQTMWPHLCKGLLRMDQFRLVPDGDSVVRQFQQRLNHRYIAQVGIPAMKLVPCDGIYSRDTQQGMMMAIQYEVGIPLGSINGYFGPGTKAGLKGAGSGSLTGDLRYLFRSACYANSPTMQPGMPAGSVPLDYSPDDIATDDVTATHEEWVRSFQRFSQIPDTGENDYTTWAQLLISSGDTERPAAGCDCVTEITAVRAQQLLEEGYLIVGRYLDEHLSPGDPGYLGKALKPGEAQTIVDAGLRLLPIFQYNGRNLSNFTFEKGYEQSQIAHQKAIEHGIPPGTCIYFAVDYDAMDSEIDSNIMPYFDGVNIGFDGLGNRYTYGVYGSRNVCSRISRDTGARWSFVSGMSWGFSGNLGFPMPVNWSFNQIREYEFQPGWGLDHDVWREGADPGVIVLATEE